MENVTISVNLFSKSFMSMKKIINYRIVIINYNLANGPAAQLGTWEQKVTVFTLKKSIVIRCL